MTPAKKATTKQSATKKATKKATAKKAATKKGSYSGFSAEERAAMKEYAAELKGTNDLDTLLAKIADMPAEDRALAERVHEIVTKAAPGLEPSTWYGMPAYKRDGQAVVFFQPAIKFKARYATLGFNEGAQLDEGDFWPTSYAVVKLTAAVEKQIAALVRRAAG